LHRRLEEPYGGGRTLNFIGTRGISRNCTKIHPCGLSIGCPARPSLVVQPCLARPHWLSSLVLRGPLQSEVAELFQVRATGLLQQVFLERLVIIFNKGLQGYCITLGGGLEIWSYPFADWRSHLLGEIRALHQVLVFSLFLLICHNCYNNPSHCIVWSKFHY
jgi:hypothetical protein